LRTTASFRWQNKWNKTLLIFSLIAKIYIALSLFILYSSLMGSNEKVFWRGKKDKLVLSQRAYRRVQSSIKVTSQKSYLRKKEKNQQFINLTVCRIGVKKTYPIAYCNQLLLDKKEKINNLPMWQFFIRIREKKTLIHL